MEFVFNEAKAAQAAAMLLERHERTMPYIKLIKLLYLADRQSLIETGSPITGDRFVSMKHGPVLSRVLDLIGHPPPPEHSIWHACIRRERHDAVLIDSVGSDQLSEYEISVLEEVFQAHGAEKPWTVVDHTHALPEWTDPGGTSTPIAPEDILGYAGYSEEEIRAVSEQAEAVRSFRGQLAQAR